MVIEAEFMSESNPLRTARDGSTRGVRKVWRGYIRAETEHESIAVVAVPPVQAQPSVSKSSAFRPSHLCGASYLDGSFSLDSC